MMKKTKELDNILDECLERVLFKGEAIEQCLASYPEQAAELEPLLQTAMAAREASAIKPRPEFRARARYQLQAVLREMEQKRQKHFSFFSWQPRWATAVVAVLVIVVAGSGTVAAAGNSMPDEVLYPVKLATEAVRVKLTPSALGKAELYVSLADKRITEIVYLADKGESEQVERATQRLSTHLVAAANLIAPPEEEAAVFMTPTPGPTEEKAPEMLAPKLVPESAVEEAPVPTVPKPAERKAPVRLAPEPAVEQAPVSPAPRSAVREVPPSPGRERAKGQVESGKVDKRAKIWVEVARNAADNPAALRDALEKAPESVKPALRRAIEVADAGYKQTLKALD